MIALSITTCRRYDVFIKTIESFKSNCIDIDCIEHVIHYDDSSDIKDRISMQNVIRDTFKNANISEVYFEVDNIKSKKRHLEIMKIWKTQIMLFDYVFHLEDDWLFINNFSIKEGVDLLKNNDDVALVGYSWKKKKFPTKLFTPKQIGNFWEWYFSEKHHINEALFLDEVEMEHLPPGHWVKYINWPYFGFRPAVHDVKKLNTIENFQDGFESFELEFAIRFSKKFKSFLHNDRVCYHIGDESAYEINNSKR